jgi:DNA-binding GntR family transcriptional regulator
MMRIVNGPAAFTVGRRHAGRGDQMAKSTRDAEPNGARRGSSAGRIYNELRDKILSVEFAPGTELDETALERLFSVSRTPVREALIRLASEGLVRSEPNRGAIVAPIGIDSLKQFFEAFELLQRAATRWCALRRTEPQLAAIDAERLRFEQAVSRGDPSQMNAANRAFHSAIAAGSQNDYITTAYDRMLAEGYRLSHISYAYSSMVEQSGSAHLARLIDEHRAMADAIRQRDAARAEKLGQEHAWLFRSHIQDYLVRSESLDLPLHPPWEEG